MLARVIERERGTHAIHFIPFLLLGDSHMRKWERGVGEVKRESG